MSKYFRRIIYTIKKWKYILVSFVLLCLIFLTTNSRNINKNKISIESNKMIENNLDIDFVSPELMFRPLYKLIDESYGIDQFIKKPLSERCEIYFEKLYEYNPNWSITSKLGAEFNHLNIDKSFDLININIYNNCFIKDNNKENLKVLAKLQKKFKNLDLLMYPYLSGKMPLFQHWTGEISYGPPTHNINYKTIDELSIDNEIFYKYDPSKLKIWNSVEYSLDSPFWLNYKNHLNDIGIVVSVNDILVNEAISLIKNLRDLGNKLPIQFIHRGDLSNLSKFKLFKASRLLNTNLTKQDIWFVDISFSINEKYKNEFPKYFNKILAYSFNTFKTMIMLDTDIILFQNPITLLNSSQFRSSNTLFFKDRNLNMHMSNEFIQFLKFTSPNKIDEILFNLNSVDTNSEIWRSDYFKEKYFHYMESGVVVINRFKYWNAVILSTHLSFIQSTFIGSWGDKEHFWMSLLLSGFDNFQFNKYWSASVGNIINYENNNINYHKICSSHPAHILSDSNELSWLNSGILNCPKTNDNILKNDFNDLLNDKGTKIFKYEFNSINELKQYYLKPIDFEGFIIPPLAKFNIEDSNSKESSYPTEGLEKTNYCNGYTWCAYDIIGNGGREEYNGIFQKFTTEQIKWYNYIAQSYLDSI